MTQTELIDRLCAVTTMLADIVREQESIIEQHRMLDEEEGQALREMRRAADKELDILEYNLRPFNSTGSGKED